LETIPTLRLCRFSADSQHRKSYHESRKAHAAPTFPRQQCAASLP
jgi:hypothetical protein